MLENIWIAIIIRFFFGSSFSFFSIFLLDSLAFVKLFSLEQGRFQPWLDSALLQKV